MSRAARCVIFVVVFALGACGGGAAITARELASIMPSAANAPAGTDLKTDLSGSKTLDEFVTAADVQTKLRALGFRVAWVSTYATASFPSDPSKAPPGAVLYGASAILLRDDGAAEQGFDFYVARLRKRAKNLAPVLIKDLGAESFAFRFSSLEDTPLPGIAFLARVENGLFSVLGVGNPGPDPNAARALARFIVSHAERA